jgi:hypothetical protein
MRQPDNLPAFCRVHRHGRPLIGYSEDKETVATLIRACSSPSDQDWADVDTQTRRALGSMRRVGSPASDGIACRRLLALQLPLMLSPVA